MKTQESVSQEEVNKVIKTLNESSEKYNYKFTTIVDEEFPEQFKEMSNPPFAVFYKGELERVINEINNKPSITPVSALGKEHIDHKKAVENFTEKFNGISVIGTQKYFKNMKDDLEQTQVVLIKEQGILNTIGTAELEKVSAKSGGVVISFTPYMTMEEDISELDKSQAMNARAALSDGMLIFTSEKEEALFTEIMGTLMEGGDVFAYNATQENNLNNTLISKGALKAENNKELFSSKENSNEISIEKEH